MCVCQLSIIGYCNRMWYEILLVTENTGLHLCSALEKVTGKEM